MANWDKKQQRIVERKRARSSFFDLTEEKLETIRKSILQSVRKKVTQFTFKGEKIETHGSASEVSKITVVLASAIGRAASGLSITAGGFLWLWGNEEKVDVEALRKDKA